MPTAATVETDDEKVAALLGRPPAGRFDVVVGDDVGEPVVIRNAPLLDDGTPMPARYWLVETSGLAAVSRLEAAGGRAAEAAVDASELAAAHARYAAERDNEVPHDAVHRPTGGVGGTRQGVKCLHAHYAWHLAGGSIRSVAGSPPCWSRRSESRSPPRSSSTTAVRRRRCRRRSASFLADSGDSDPRRRNRSPTRSTIADDVDNLLRQHPDVASGAASSSSATRRGRAPRRRRAGERPTTR